MADVVIICLIAATAAAVLVKMRKDRKNGRFCGGCSDTARCRSCKDFEKEQK